MRKILNHFILAFMLFLTACGGGMGSMGGMGGDPLSSGESGIMDIGAMLQNATGNNQNYMLARLEVQTFTSALRTLQSQLPFISSHQQGQSVHHKLNIITGTLTGQDSNAHINGGSVSVDAVQQQIGTIIAFVNYWVTQMQYMTPDRLNDFVQRLRVVNKQVASITVTPGGFMMGQGQSMSPMGDMNPMADMNAGYM